MLQKACMVVFCRGNLSYPKSIGDRARTQESKQDTRIKEGLGCFFKVKINCWIQL